MRHEPRSGEHFASLDALRGIAAVGVAFGHVQWTYSLTNTNLWRNCYLPVDFFFVLSGFVIAFNYSTRLDSGAGVARFTWLRFWRLYPLHITMLFVFLAIEVLKWEAQRHYGLVANHPAFEANNTRAFVLNVFLLQSLTLTQETFNGPSWSISTEFYAYLIFALAAFAAGRRLAWAAAAIVLATGAVLAWNGGEMKHTVDPLAFNRCLLGFFLGVLVFFAVSKAQALQRLTPRAAALLAGTPVAAMAVFLLLNRGQFDYLAPLLSAAIVFALAATPRNAVQAALSTRPLVWLGQRSYSVYMVHIAVFWLMTQAMRVLLHLPSVVNDEGVLTLSVPTLTGDLLLIPAFAAVLLASHLTYRLIEMPLRNWSKAAWPTPRKALAPAQ